MKISRHMVHTVCTYICIYIIHFCSTVLFVCVYICSLNRILQIWLYCSLKDLDGFIKKTVVGLSKTVEEGDYDGLVDVMIHLLAVKDRQATTDTMFEPLKQTIELLKSYDQEMSDEVHQQLQELPEQWNSVKKQSVVVKQDVAPLQTTEANNIRRKANSFDVSLIC